MPSTCGYTLNKGGRKTYRKKTWRQKHHSIGIGKLHKGDLSSKGYSVKKTLRLRHKALKKVVKSEGPLSTFRKLNAIAVYTKNESPTKSKTFKRDRNWVRKTFMKK